MLGSSVFIANPPHTLVAELRPAVAWLAQTLGQFKGAHGMVEAA
jgi:23S rRNA (adenine2030-N6)-methyltransferase